MIGNQNTAALCKGQVYYQINKRDYINSFIPNKSYSRLTQYDVEKEKTISKLK